MKKSKKKKLNRKNNELNDKVRTQLGLLIAVSIIPLTYYSNLMDIVLNAPYEYIKYAIFIFIVSIVSIAFLTMSFGYISLNVFNKNPSNIKTKMILTKEYRLQRSDIFLFRSVILLGLSFLLCINLNGLINNLN